MRTYMVILLLLVAGCSLSPIKSTWFSKAKAQAPEFSTPDKKAMFILGKADDLFFVLIIAAVGGLVLGLWARTAIGFYITAACAIGAVALLLLAQFSTYIGYGILALVIAGIVYAATRWRQVADAAIIYADDLKKHVPEDKLKWCNEAATKVQKRSVQKYIHKRRNGNGNDKENKND